MNHIFYTLILGVLVTMLAPCALSAADLRVEQAWVRATPPNAVNSAVFGSLFNATNTEDRLLSATCEVANEVQLHTVEVSADGVKAMRQVSEIPVPAGSTVVLKPGSFHIMLIGLKRPLVAGEKLPVTFTFATAGAQPVQILISEVTASGPTAAAGDGNCPLCEEKKAKTATTAP